MNGLSYIAPLFLVILSNTAYHLLSKTTSAQLNPFAALTATYGMSFLGCIALFLLTHKDPYLAELSQLRPANFIMGLVIIGIEGGYLMMYQKGWEISRASVMTNICVAILLFLLGVLLFHEGVSPKKVAGIILCAAGIALVNLG